MLIKKLSSLTPLLYKRNSTIRLMKAELYILGVLHRGDFHPYEIKRRLTQAMIECFTDVDVGTLYYAVRQLAECRLLTAVAHQRVARGGMRTVYRITPRGRDRFRELLHAQFAAEGNLRETLYGPMLFFASRRPQTGRRGSAHPNRQAERAAGGDPEIASAMGNDAVHR
jgi:DNA-binding PadR family transcriptional regulator